MPDKELEREFYKLGSIVVSSTRFVVGSAMYPINGITSVQTVRIPPSRSGALLLGIIGVGVALWNPIVGGLVILSAIMLGVSRKAQFIVRIATAGGQHDALTSADEDQISAVTRALHDAVAHRG